MKISRSKITVYFLSIMALLNSGCSSEAVVDVDKSNDWKLPLLVVREEPVVSKYGAVGAMVAHRKVTLSSKIAGHIIAINVREGDTVSRGQVLARLDDSANKNAITMAQVSVATASALLKDTQTDLHRYENLYKQGSISEAKVRKTRLQRDSALEKLTMAKSSLSIALAERKYFEIKSSSDGLIVARHQQEGDTAMPGQPILTVESHKAVVFETFVAQSQLPHINLGDPVRVELDGLTEPFEGKVTHIVNSVNQENRSHKIKVGIIGMDSVRSGMFGRAWFTTGTKNKILVPKTAIVQKGGLRGVFVVNEGNRAQFRWLDLKQLKNKHYEIGAGLVDGEKIITSIKPNLREGDIVAPFQPVAG